MEPGTHVGSNSAVRTQSQAVFASLVAAVVALAISLLVFRGGAVPFSDVDLSDTGTSGVGSVRSVGGLAVYLGGLLGSLVFVLAYAQSVALMDALPAGGPGPSIPPPRLARRILDTIALLLTHLGIWVVLCFGLFAILQRAIVDAALDALTASAFVAAAISVAVYSMQASASSISAFRVSTLLTVFIGAGMLVSMATTPDPAWWQRNFSALGTVDGFSGTIFNFTLIVTGAVLVTLADYLMADLREWAGRQPPGVGTRVPLVGAGVAGIGLCLAGVGAFPADSAPIPHLIAALGLVLVFGALALSFPWLLPGFPGMFVVLGYAAVALIVLVTVLYIPFGIYNQTALELVGAAMVIGWTIVFIRTVGALRADAEAPPVPVRRALR
jgi:hypothetical membrane protein